MVRVTYRQARGDPREFNGAHANAEIAALDLPVRPRGMLVREGDEYPLFTPGAVVYGDLRVALGD